MMASVHQHVKAELLEKFDMRINIANDELHVVD